MTGKTKGRAEKGRGKRQHEQHAGPIIATHAFVRYAGEHAIMDS
jgi:hypothetical protein